MSQLNSHKKTVYIECTHTMISGLNTGIQRVVREVIRNLPEIAGLDGYQIKTITFQKDRFIHKEFLPLTAGIKKKTSFSFWHLLKLIFLYSRRSIAFILPDGKLKFFINGPRYDKRTLAHFVGFNIVDPLFKVIWNIKELLKIDKYKTPDFPKIEVFEGDILLLLDSSWYIKFWDEIERFKLSGAKVYNVVYDLIPITHPQFCDDYLVHVFKTYFHKSTFYVDKYICISNTVAKDLDKFLKGNSAQEKASEISFFHLGSDFKISNFSEDQVSSEIKAVFKKQLPIYLIVCTIEPRKNHEYLLDVFNQLWAEGHEVGLCIVGRIGWKVDALIDSILSHPLLGKKLFMFNDATDMEVSYCYQYSQALLFPSVVEGFGLPIIEGLQRSLPVFASGTSIHKEVGKNFVNYFDITEKKTLKDLLLDHLRNPDKYKVDSSKVKATSWQESSHWLWREIRN